ncbi:MAG: penicillin-binding protein activator [Bradymonadaceae bacterium]|nr:penicillin-binding protein activator [Lujinxingiaceae bacterium]
MAGLKIGVVVPLSGEFAPMGRQVVEAARLGAERFGLELVVRDSQGQPEDAVRAVSELGADPSIVAILGPIGRRESQAAASVAHRLALPLLTLSSVEQVNLIGPTIFRLRLSPGEQARTIAQAASERLKLSRAAVMFVDNEYGNAAALAFVQEFTTRGGTVVAVAAYDESTTNFARALDVLTGKSVFLGRSQMLGKRRADANGYLSIRREAVIDFDAIFIPDFHQRVARILSFLPEAGLQTGDGGEGVGVQLLGLAGWQGKSMELTGGLAAGAIYTDVFVGAEEGGSAEAFGRYFEGRTGRAAVDLDAEVYDALTMVGALLSDTAHDGTARARLVARLGSERNWKGVCGALSFGSRGEPLRPVRLFRFDVGGTVVPLF